MNTLTRGAPSPPKDYSACSGCSLCLLVCPVWRRTHDLGMTPHGRAKALQHGASAADIAASVESCSLCAACEPVCPEEIDLVGMTLQLRRQLVQPAMLGAALARMNARTQQPAAPPLAARAALLAGAALRGQPNTLARAAALLGDGAPIAALPDDGEDIVEALIGGVTVPAARLERFLAPLRRLQRIVVADGLLLYHLRRWLPRAQFIGLGEALGSLPALRRQLRASDLYVIEARAYHADYQRQVKYYDGLRRACGCSFNLDLQRIAIPAAAPGLRHGLEPEADDDGGGQARWILQGRNVARIVVEDVEDRAAFERVSRLPVVHLADLADDGISSQCQPFLK